MREIKFRIPMFTDKDHFVEFQYLSLGDDIIGTLCGHNGEPQQYTGLKDRNGIEIYEGDKVKATSTEYQKGGGKMKEEHIYRVSITLSGVRFDSYPYNKYSKIKVIGNVHENHELSTNPKQNCLTSNHQKMYNAL